MKTTSLTLRFFQFHDWPFAPAPGHGQRHEGGFSTGTHGWWRDLITEIRLRSGKLIEWEQLLLASRTANSASANGWILGVNLIGLAVIV